MSAMTIGRLAKRTGVNIDTIRYYERNRLLPEPARRLSGYREYGPADVARLRFIMRAKDLGFSLAEIAELLLLSADRDVRGVKRRAEAHLEQVEHKIKELQRVRRASAGTFPGESKVGMQNSRHCATKRVPQTGNRILQATGGPRSASVELLPASAMTRAGCHLRLMDCMRLIL